MEGERLIYAGVAANCPPCEAGAEGRKDEGKCGIRLRRGLL